jgi:hypothetical protein
MKALFLDCLCKGWLEGSENRQQGITTILGRWQRSQH